VSEEKDKPVFDEQTLAKLLEAAYVLQEHSQELRSLQAELGLPRKASEEEQATKPAEPQDTSKKVEGKENNQAPAAAKGKSGTSPENSDYATVLGKIAEVQFQIQDQHLTPDQGMALVTEQLIDICGAAGAAIGLSNGSKISYRAVAGIRTLPLGSTVPLAKALCFPCLRTGQAFRCRDVNAQPPIDTQECRRRGIGSLIAVPVFQEHGTAGGLELYFSDAAAFTEQDVQTCQMMAGIITQSLETHGSPAQSSGTPSGTVNARKSAVPSDAARCYKCGNELVGEEQFCGECGAARSRDAEPLGMQTKVAALLHKQPGGNIVDRVEAAKALVKESHTDPVATAENSTTSAELLNEIRALQQSLETSLDPGNGNSHVESSNQINQQVESQQENTLEASSPVESSAPAEWSSALSAREFLEQVGGGSRARWLATFWNEHRGDIYLAVSIVLVVIVMRWGLWTRRPAATANTPQKAHATEHKPPAPQLSLFDRMLVSMGLAEEPETPENKGNPSTTVWVDLHSGIYYCPGADMYGKTPKGKYASQRDAQLDQFAPAYRKACD